MSFAITLLNCIILLVLVFNWHRFMVCGFRLQKDTFTQIYHVFWAYLTLPHHTSHELLLTLTCLKVIRVCFFFFFWSLEPSREQYANPLVNPEDKHPFLHSPPLQYVLYLFSKSYIELLKNAIGIMKSPGEHRQNHAYLNTMSLVVSGEHLCTQMLEYTVGLPLKKRGTDNTKRRHLS